MIWAKFVDSKDYFLEQQECYGAYLHNEGRQLLSLMLKDRYHIEFAEELLLISDKGKPYLRDFPNISFNISHCDGLVCCGINNSGLGIDCEKERNALPRVMSRCFSYEEQRAINSAQNMNLQFTKLWTLKESYVKFTGDGVSSKLNEVAFELMADKITSSVIGSFQLFIINKKYIVSVCKNGNDKGNIAEITSDLQDILILEQ